MYVIIISITIIVTNSSCIQWLCFVNSNFRCGFLQRYRLSRCTFICLALDCLTIDCLTIDCLTVDSLALISLDSTAGRFTATTAATARPAR